MPGGPLDKPLAKIAGRRRVASEQILLAWVKAKGAISITYASYHLRDMLRLRAQRIKALAVRKKDCSFTSLLGT